jgi:hypothetical protein
MVAGNVTLQSPDGPKRAGLYLRDLRELAGLNQTEVAGKVAESISGFNRPRLSMAECGHVRLAAEEAAAVERAILFLAQERAFAVVSSASGVRAAV